MPKIYGNIDVLEAARRRIAYLLEEFDNYVVGFSGGKDSTVLLELVVEQARRLGKLPVPTWYTDKEAEWECAIDFIRATMHRPEIKPLWIQVPLRVHNANSYEHPWLTCWEPGVEWMREKEDIAVKVNDFGVDRSEKMREIFVNRTFDKPVAKILGLRCEESPRRLKGCTQDATYAGWVTWAKKVKGYEGIFDFYPLYDWGYRDIWKAIHEHGWKYCPLYDRQFALGVELRKMRVHHLVPETSTQSLLCLQEIEPHTWEKMVRRFPGTNQFKHCGSLLFQQKNNKLDLPLAFESWKEYRDYLAENLLPEGIREQFFGRFSTMDEKYAGLAPVDFERMLKKQVLAILNNDNFMTILDNWEVKPEVAAYCKIMRRGYILPPEIPYAKYAFNAGYEVGRESDG